jgi:hypothetical protein
MTPFLLLLLLLSQSGYIDVLVGTVGVEHLTRSEEEASATHKTVSMCVTSQVCEACVPDAFIWCVDA